MRATEPAKLVERLPMWARGLLASAPTALRDPRTPVVVGALLVLNALVTWPLWEDELFTWFVSVQFDFAMLLTLVRADPHPPGYFGLTWILGRIGSADIWLRLPSAVAAVAAVAVVGRLGRRLGVGGAGAWVLALLPFFVVYGAMARPYGLTLLGGAVLLAGSLVGPLRRAAVVVGAAGAILMHLHYANALPIAAALFALALRGFAEEGLRGVRPPVIAGAAIGLAFLPWWMVGASQQVSRQLSVPMDVSVLGYLLWPIGRIVPHAALPLVAAAAVGAWRLARGTGSVGARRALIAWVAAAVLLPLAASTKSMTTMKLYVFAPFLPLFAIAAGEGVRAGFGALRARLGAPGAAVVGALCGVLPAADLVTMASWPAVPVELAIEGSGSYDVREELDVLLPIEPTLNPRLVDNRPWTGYERYGPNPATIPDRVGGAPWYGWRREAGAEATARAQGARDTLCLFPFAVTSVIYVAEPTRCAALRTAVVAAAERTGRAPFLLEAARIASETGALAEAEGLARRAIPGMLSAQPHEFLARRRYEQGDVAGAIGWLEAGSARAAGLGLRATVRQLEAQRASLAEQVGDADTAASAQARTRCAEGEAPLMLCRTPLAGWLGAESGDGAGAAAGSGGATGRPAAGGAGGPGRRAGAGRGSGGGAR